jgi:16S rRNA (cytosine1402-N4)-methyltransferase
MMLSSEYSPVPVHRTVLLDEAVEGVISTLDGVYIDGTFGRGGHSRALLSRLSSQATLLVFDKDPEAIAVAEHLAHSDARVKVFHCSFAHMREALQNYSGELNRDLKIAGVLLDLGISSPQIDTPERGFSFRFNGPLDMRMDTTRGIPVSEWLAHATVDDITRIIREYGEERFAPAIARAIVARCAQADTLGALNTTAELAKLIASVVKTREKGQDPATRTFQALRIFINAELDDLEVGLKAAHDLLAPGGRLSVISFHSLEDRIVKKMMVRYARPEADMPHDYRLRYLPAVQTAAPTLKLLGKQRPSDAEIKSNPRARSAMLRIAERLFVEAS